MKIVLLLCLLPLLLQSTLASGEEDGKDVDVDDDQMMSVETVNEEDEESKIDDVEPELLRVEPNEEESKSRTGRQASFSIQLSGIGGQNLGYGTGGAGYGQAEYDEWGDYGGGQIDTTPYDAWWGGGRPGGWGQTNWGSGQNWGYGQNNWGSGQNNWGSGNSGYSGTHDNNWNLGGTQIGAFNQNAWQGSSWPGYSGYNNGGSGYYGWPSNSGGNGGYTNNANIGGNQNANWNNGGWQGPVSQTNWGNMY